jgi:uncharacterized membrane protein YiaA
MAHIGRNRYILGVSFLRKIVLCSLAALTIILVVGATINPTMAANYNQVGVKVGDTADYKIDMTTITDNKTRLYFTYISKTIVSFDDLSFWPNGTLHSSTSWTGNVSTYEFPIYFCLLAAGLKVGDHIGTNPVSPTIDVNTTLTAAGASRLANHAHLEGFLFYLDGYWDKETGLLVKGSFFSLFYLGWFNATLISTTVWSPSGALSMTTIALIEGAVIVMLLIAMVFMARRRGKHK